MGISQGWTVDEADRDAVSAAVQPFAGSPTRPQPNAYGVYLRDVCEVAAECPGIGTTKRLRRVPMATILVVQVAPANWLWSYNYQFRHGSMCGGGAFPSKGSDRRAHSRDEAIADAARELRDIARQVQLACGADARRAAAAPHPLPPLQGADQDREARHLEAWATALLSGMRGQQALDLVGLPDGAAPRPAQPRRPAAGGQSADQLGLPL